MKISVIVCVKNEEKRIKDCLDSIISNSPDEIILVDGESKDKTKEIASKYDKVKIIVSKNSNLTRDRQIGINEASNDLIAMIDADHRLRNDDLNSLCADMKKYNFDIVQSGLLSYENDSFWGKAEEESWMITQNIPGKRNMLGTAPALYKKKVFDLVKFDDSITSTIDDTDFSYRLSKFKEISFGVGETKIHQYHFGSFFIYLKKFIWYGKGDGEFCFKNPERSLLMLFHLIIRYPIIHSLKALLNGKIRAAIFFFFQGLVRLVGLVGYFLRIN